MNNIDIEIKKRSRIKIILSTLHNRIEDLAFSIIQKLPDRFITPAFMNWIDRYTTKRMNELQAQLIKDRWKAVELKKTLDQISNR